eukprot:scaffold16521_cov66-Cyclotella_meneghiniana.AAC.24
MGKRGKTARKRQRDNNEASPSSIASKILKKQQTKQSEEDVDAADGIISDEELETTIATLKKLNESFDASGKPVIKDKRYRNLRRILYDLQKILGATASSGATNTPLCTSVATATNAISFSKITNEISTQIEHGAWDTAVTTLRNLRRIQDLQQLIHQTNEGNVKSDPGFSQYRPKLGSLQRWVREIDAAGTSDPLALEVLDAILRVVAPESIVSIDAVDLARSSWAHLGMDMGTDNKIIPDCHRGRIRLFPAFDVMKNKGYIKHNESSSQAKGEQNDLYDKLVSRMTCGQDGIRGIISDSDNSIVPEDYFRVCGHEDGKERKPPNKYDLDLLTTSVINEQQLINNNEIHSTISSCNILIERSINCHQITKTPIPYVHNAFMLENVLSAPECDRLLAATEMAGYCPDEPLAGQPGASILAHACVWVVDHLMERSIFDRVKRFLPSYEQPTEQPETFNPIGINRRFRFYRYVPGRYYRPHIDGAWPSSGFDVNGNYRYDINDIANKNGMQFVPKNEESQDLKAAQTECSQSRPQLSRLTFLIYLNDDFVGGNTTFFVPAKDQEGVLNAFPVKPSRGCVLVFPHGTCDAPLHEGSPVLKGCKYVIRTEVEYFV